MTNQSKPEVLSWMEKCPHNHLRFHSGVYYIACVDCFRKWVICNPDKDVSDTMQMNQPDWKEYPQDRFAAHAPKAALDDGLNSAEYNRGWNDCAELGRIEQARVRPSAPKPSAGVQQDSSAPAEREASVSVMELFELANNWDAQCPNSDPRMTRVLM